MEQKTVDFSKAVYAFGGYSGLARRLGVPLSTCHGWARRSKLPPWRELAIAALARRHHKDVFLEIPIAKPKVKVKRGTRKRSTE